jgi:uncharacterized protein (UPF0335 family)
MGRRRKTEDGAAEAKIGHNSNISDEQKLKLGGFVSELERVDADVRELTSERGTIYKAAKEAGFDTKALKHVIKMRRMERSKRDEFESAVDAYRVALGDFVTTPLGQAMAPQSEAHPN